jgi:hypothetical protein
VKRPRFGGTQRPFALNTDAGEDEGRRSGEEDRDEREAPVVLGGGVQEEGGAGGGPESGAPPGEPGPFGLGSGRGGHEGVPAAK